MTFLTPVMVASSVENLWLYARKSHVKPHLTEALWLGCGSAGMKVLLFYYRCDGICICFEGVWSCGNATISKL